MRGSAVTTGPLERAVIEAAFTMRREVFDTGEEASPEATLALWRALDDLASHRATLAPGVKEGVGWHEVTEGDEIPDKAGNWHPVIRTLKVRRNLYEIVVQMPTGPQVLTRPSEKSPTATVRRGATGKAVDQFVHVFSSNAGRRH